MPEVVTLLAPPASCELAGEAMGVMDTLGCTDLGPPSFALLLPASFLGLAWLGVRLKLEAAGWRNCGVLAARAPAWCSLALLTCTVQHSTVQYSVVLPSTAHLLLGPARV